MLNLDEAKVYLRVDDDHEDHLIQGLIDSALVLCLDVIRSDSVEHLEANPHARLAMLYVIAYFYEHREEADYHELTLTLRALLFGLRQEGF
ncbi:head-tail connector protein [Fundicoccus ignavus]|uniref:Phage gp6-like head-tail connector protein n=1 Tax=Fundicoccus ignavus TaxID=2664442 RepID=A0A844C8K1_9LACT|nr:head-tail connector protein [Fundicoccus ignavus]MRJ47083.1 phage gp6-like head-tail connector protein [Fundicoccus ignavus]